MIVVTTITLSDLIQALAVLVAVGASIVALLISWRDRKNARRIAAEDRRAALEHAKLMFDLEALLRLQENHNRAGSTDPEESKRMGAEAMAIIAMVGPDLLPNLWQRRIGHSDEEIAAKLDDPQTLDWKKWQYETHLALDKTTKRIAEILDRGAPGHGSA